MDEKNYKLIFFEGRDDQRLKALEKSGEILAEIDIFEDCLNELFEIEHPWLKPSNGSFLPTKEAYLKDWKKKGPFKNQGVWVYYPWLKLLMHFPDEAIYIRLRTSRNRNLVTEDEQAILNTKTVGIAGMSVGSNVLNTMVLTGLGRHFKIADFDTISVPNLNRIMAPASAVGMNKAVFFARKSLEVDPFLKIEVFSNGLDEKHFHSFFLDKKIDVFVEEMDHPYLKIVSRKFARKNKIPVIMAADNGDGVLIDIERFDIEPARPLFHGRLDKVINLESIKRDLSFSEKLTIIANIVHLEEATPRAQDSLKQVGTILNTWPQLGTAALLAGVSLTFAARRVLLGKEMGSGRYGLSLDDILVLGYTAGIKRFARFLHTKSVMKDFYRLQKKINQKKP